MMKFKIVNAGYNCGCYENPFHDYLGVEIQTYKKFLFFKKYFKCQKTIIKLVYSKDYRTNCLKDCLDYLYNKSKEEIMNDIIDKVKAEYKISQKDIVINEAIQTINDSIKGFIGKEFEIDI